MSEDTIRDKASQIRLLVLDVDGTLTDGGVYIDAHGVQSKKFNIKDGMGISILQKEGFHVGFLSHSRSKTIIEERAKMLNVAFVYAGNEPKWEVLKDWTNQLQIEFRQVAYIGDDVNDLEVMQQVGLSACPHDAHHTVVRQADIVLQHKGGEGCVREFIDRFLLGV